ncbi:HK97 family phage prohead protease [Micromonospora purpureochromogenes]|uniref:HK97 family phage prohead protease n=1 Tax=Micromonospora purpureochromogenes TaxID=47872 RepID=UPI0033C7F08D
MRTKAFRAHVKTDGQGGLEPGQFEAIVSVFGNVDHGGDVVLPGAFSRSLAEWKAAGDPIPVIWSHQIGDPESHIGHVIDAAELQPGDERLPAKLRGNGGLWVRGQLDLNEPRAAKVHKLLKTRLVKQFSFSYDIVNGGPAERNGREVYELRDLDLFEVGPTLLGMNPETELVGAKSDQHCRSCVCGTGDDGKKAVPVPVNGDEEPAEDVLQRPESTAPTLSPADVLLSLQVDALAYDLDT